MASLQPDKYNTAPTAQTGGTSGSQMGDEPNWLARAQRAYYSSTTYVDANYRKTWDDSIRAFNNQHPIGSKYNAPAYDKRSRIYRPKTRTIIRKNEAAAAAAFFSNMEVTSVLPCDPTNISEVASAEIMKQLLQYRLTKTIPWFQTLIGGLQDAQTTGVVCGHIHWLYEEETAEDKAEEIVEELKPKSEEYPEQEKLPENALMATPEGGLSEQPSEQTSEQPEITVAVVQNEPKVIKDEPAIDLIPAENIRIDSSASWIDPINTSPYVIHLIPMYAMDVKEKMKKGEWKKVNDTLLAAATEITPDTTRLARNKNGEDPYSATPRDVKDYEIVWVQRHIHKHAGKDVEFYTCGDLALLTDPEPLVNTVFTGKRPYIMGNCNIETHKIMPSSAPALCKALQDETNEIANQRLDNVKFVLNKKWFVKRGKEADVQGLLRNVPGGVVMLDDPENDVREISWNDVTASSYEEHKALSMETDELMGNFNPAALMIQGPNVAPARNMAMLSNSTGTMTEYMLRTYVETFVQPALRMLMLLEQKYETDETILAFAGKRAKVFQRFGIDEVTDDLLEKELTLNVNVGMGATDAGAKLNKFIAGISAYSMIMAKPTPGLNVEEVGKEIFGNLGYSDGSRFTSTENPQVLQLQAQLQQAGAVIQQLQQKVKEKTTGHLIGLQKAREANKTTIAKTQIQETNENRRSLATHMRALMEAGKQMSK